MSYCGICNNHNVVFTKVEGGYHCGGCDKIQFDDELDRDNIKKTLLAAKLGKKEGWKFYPNIEGFGDPIDKVIAEYESKAKLLGIN